MSLARLVVIIASSFLIVPINLAPAAPQKPTLAAPQKPTPAAPQKLTPAVVQKRVALVIGNGAYKNANKLPNPAHDATDIAVALKKFGFDVIDGRDLTKREMEDRIVAFGRKLDDAALALFFYAGHGMQVSGKNYLIPIDAKLQRQADLSLETFDIEIVLQQMEGGNRVNLIFLDACRDNPFVRSFSTAVSSRSLTAGNGLAQMEGGAGTLIAFSTTPGKTASDGTGRNSPFTSALLKHIETPGLEIGMLMRRVRDDVIIATSNNQVTWDNSSLRGGDVILVPGPPTLVRTDGSQRPPAAPSEDAAAAAWAQVKGTKHLAVLEDFILRFGESFYVTLARAALEDLKGSLVAAPTTDNRQIDQQWKFCKGTSDVDWNTQIDNCTKLIQSERETKLTRSTALLNRALAWFANKEYNRSISDYNESIKLNPTARAYDHRGRAYRITGDTARAIADFTSAIKLDPKFVVAYYDRASSYRSKGDYDRAIADYSDAIKLNPQFVPAFTYRGETYRAKRDYDSAIADYNEAIRIDPKYVFPFINRGYAFVSKHEYDRAIDDFTEAIKLDPVYAYHAYYNRGYAYESKKDYERAIADYTEAIKLYPAYAFAYNNRGYSYASLKDYDRAIADYTESIKYNSKFPRAYNNRGYAYYVKMDYDRAISDFNETIKLDPRDSFARLNRGRAYAATKDYDRAILDFTAAIELDPKGEHGCAACAYNARGLANRAMNDEDRALKDFNEAIKLDPKVAAYFDNRARTYRAKGNYDSAIADDTEAIKLDPKNGNYYASRGRTYSVKTDYDRAIADYSAAIGLSPNDYSAYFGRGRAYFYSGSLDNAQSDFKKANELNPKHGFTALWLDIAERRNNVPSELKDIAAKLEKQKWPEPIVQFFLEELKSAEAVLAAADDKNQFTKRGQICEANFYIGQSALIKGAKNDAIRFFRLTANDCPRSFIEWDAAKAELKALGETR